MDRFPSSLMAAIGGAYLGGALADFLAVPKEYRGGCVLLGTTIAGLLGYFWLYRGKAK